MHQIKPHLLWVGHAGDGRDIHGLLASQLRAVVQLAVEEPAIETPRELIYCRFPLVDGPSNDPNIIRMAVMTVASLLQHRVPTLVCCGGGMSRSPAIAAAALSTASRKNIEDCLKLVTDSAPADILPGLWLEITDVVKLSHLAG